MAISARAITNENGYVLTHSYKVASDYTQNTISVWELDIPLHDCILADILASDVFSMLANKALDNGFNLSQTCKTGVKNRVKVLKVGGIEYRSRGGLVYSRKVVL